MPLDSGRSTYDARKDTWTARLRFSQARRAQERYTINLRKIARHVGDIIGGFAPGDPTVLPQLELSLSRYAEVIRPWARATAAKMLADVASRDEKIWAEHARAMGRAIRYEISGAQTGEVLKFLMEEQVGLITSIPIEAGRRVHSLTYEALSSSARSGEIVKEIMRSTDVTLARATLIARTETGRAATSFTEARAKHLGSTSYVWRAVPDNNTRSRHRDLDGSVHLWTEPPIAGESGEKYHPGCGPNCRCFAEPVLPSEF